MNFATRIEEHENISIGHLLFQRFQNEIRLPNPIAISSWVFAEILFVGFLKRFVKFMLVVEVYFVEKARIFCFFADTF